MGATQLVEIFVAQQATRTGETGRGWLLAFLSVWILLLITFFAWPGSIEGKGLAVLHGLCAQQPGHSFYFGESRLPFDARMTGIYGGFAAVVVTLLVRRRWRAAGIPPLRTAVLMAMFVALLAVDGLNSTLRDLGLWHPYPPHNLLRLGTGLLTGAALAAFLWLMIAQVGFHRHARRIEASVSSGRDLLDIAIALTIVAALVASSWEPLRIPLTLLLLASAISVVLGLVLPFVLLVSQREGRAVSTFELMAPATLSLVIALALIGSMSGGRFFLEAWLNMTSTGGR
jgi:uncharacterized membrane protein